jgi:hypothetical protein
VYIPSLESNVGFNVVRPQSKYHNRDSSRPTLLGTEGSLSASQPSFSPKSANDDGKTHVIWDTDVPKVQAWFESAKDRDLADVDLELGEADEMSDEGFTPQNSVPASESGSCNLSDGGMTPRNMAVVVRRHQRDDIQRGPHAPYMDGASVEYFSSTNQRWMAGVIKLQASEGCAIVEELHLHVQLSQRSQFRADVTLDNVRPILEPNELVEVLVEEEDLEGGLACRYLPAFVAGKQSKGASILGYHVQVETTGQVLRNVPAIRLRRRFPAGARVEIFRVPSLGWCEGSVHGEIGTSDGCGNEGFSPLPDVQELEEKPLPVKKDAKKHSNANTHDHDSVEADAATATNMGLWTYVPICIDTESFESIPSYLVRLATSI